MTSIRITQRNLSFLSGFWRTFVPADRHEIELMCAIREAKVRSDGSTEVNLTASQRRALADYMDAFAAGATTVSDRHSARSLLRQIARLKETP